MINQLLRTSAFFSLNLFSGFFKQKNQSKIASLGASVHAYTHLKSIETSACTWES
jgi:hypothetical protein